jgi:hypothetical protein
VPDGPGSTFLIISFLKHSVFVKTAVTVIFSENQGPHSDRFLGPPGSSVSDSLIVGGPGQPYCA